MHTSSLPLWMAPNTRVLMPSLPRAHAQVGKQLPCGHTFHLGCLRAWMQQSGVQATQLTCPNCRQPLIPKPLRREPGQTQEEEEEDLAAILQPPAPPAAAPPAAVQASAAAGAAGADNSARAAAPVRLAAAILLVPHLVVWGLTREYIFLLQTITSVRVLCGACAVQRVCCGVDGCYGVCTVWQVTTSRWMLWCMCCVAGDHLSVRAYAMLQTNNLAGVLRAHLCTSGWVTFVPCNVTEAFRRGCVLPCNVTEAFRHGCAAVYCSPSCSWPVERPPTKA